jgi:hypothetical protein
MQRCSQSEPTKALFCHKILIIAIKFRVGEISGLAVQLLAYSKGRTVRNYARYAQNRGQLYNSHQFDLLYFGSSKNISISKKDDQHQSTSTILPDTEGKHCSDL